MILRRSLLAQACTLSDESQPADSTSGSPELSKGGSRAFVSVRCYPADFAPDNQAIKLRRWSTFVMAGRNRL
jgi:hypothetical protein